jgi:porphobilinogen synthase
MELNSPFLQRRPRRNRASESIRQLVRETNLESGHLVLPLFLMEGNAIHHQIPSLPVAARMSLDNILRTIESAIGLGVNSFMIFPAVPEKNKDKIATYSYAEDNFYLEASRKIKEQFPESCLISDVAMDPYSSDGHDGYVENGKIINDITLPILAKMSVAQAQAGFDILGPSDMMDGRVGVIREALDKAGYYNTGIMSYTAKYASAFYGPFRDALDSAPKSGDKKTYQMDPANSREALIEAELDTQEGADFLMVKPALHYLDIIKNLSSNFDTPIAAYHVSGECAMLLAACQNGWLDYEKAMPETLTSIRRAGASVIISYLAMDFARWVKR